MRLWDAQISEPVSSISCLSRYPQIEFPTELDLKIVAGKTSEIPSQKVREAMVDLSSCTTSNLQIDDDGDRGMKSSERVLWLPPAYRPVPPTSYGNTLVIGSGNGHVFCLSLEDGLG